MLGKVLFYGLLYFVTVGLIVMFFMGAHEDEL
jgi:hypothetical protein